MGEEERITWKERGYRDKVSKSRPGKVGKIGWGLMADFMGYNLLESAETMTMPLLLIVGSEDDSTPPAHQKMLFDVWEGQKEYNEIQGCGHNFTTDEELRELKYIFDNWIKEIS